MKPASVIRSLGWGGGEEFGWGCNGAERSAVIPKRSFSRFILKKWMSGTDTQWTFVTQYRHLIQPQAGGLSTCLSPFLSLLLSLSLSEMLRRTIWTGAVSVCMHTCTHTRISNSILSNSSKQRYERYPKTGEDIQAVGQQMDCRFSLLQGFLIWFT